MLVAVVLFYLLDFAPFAQSKSASFTNPPKRWGKTADVNLNAVHAVGDSMTRTWTTDTIALDLSIWQYSTDDIDAGIGGAQGANNSRRLVFALWMITVR